MIRNETEYQEASTRLTEGRNRLAEHRVRLREAGLTPAERRMLKDPGFITEDEADLIYSVRTAGEETFSAEAVFAEPGIPFPRRRPSA